MRIGEKNSIGMKFDYLRGVGDAKNNSHTCYCCTLSREPHIAGEGGNAEQLKWWRPK